MSHEPRELPVLDQEPEPYDTMPEECSMAGVETVPTSAAVPAAEPTTTATFMTMPETWPVVPLSSLDELQLPGMEWVWENYLARGCCTLLSASWKIGKTTLISSLLSQMRDGGKFAGQPVRAGRALVVTEEDLQLWKIRRDLHELHDHVRVITRPFPGVPTLRRWKRFVKFILEYRGARWWFDALVIDPLASVFPGKENDNDAMREATMPMNLWKDAGLAIGIGHHTRKNDPQPGQAARGAGALGAFVDIILEMEGFGKRTDRRRILTAYSRFSSTPPMITLELAEDGRSYQLLEAAEPTAAESSFGEYWSSLEDVFTAATDFKTIKDIARDWPIDRLKPAVKTLYKLVDQAVDEKRLVREGRGTKNDPYQYALPHQPAQWLTQRQEAAKQFGLPLPR